jgi:hypothetical protein
MVDTTQGDGVVRNNPYAKFRTDIPITPGFSAELISVHVDPKDYDDLKVETDKTFLDIFEGHVKTRPTDTYLGTRESLPEEIVDGKKVKKFGEY